MGHPNEFVEEKDLVKALANSDKQAFNQIYECHWRALYNTVYKRVSDHEVVVDILHDIFCSLWDRRESLEIVNLSAYLFQSAKFQTFKFLRRQKLKNDVEKDVVSFHSTVNTEIPLLEKEAFQKLQVLVQKLTPKQQEIFRLRYEEHKTPLQIAEIKQLSAKTIQNQLSVITVEIKKKLFLWALLPYFVTFSLI